MSVLFQIKIQQAGFQRFILRNIIILLFYHVCFIEWDETVSFIIPENLFLIVCIHHDKTASCLVILMTEPVLYESHQLPSYVAWCTLIFPVDTQSSYQHGRIAASTFRIYNIALQPVFIIGDISLVLILSLDKVNKATIRCGISAVTQQYVFPRSSSAYRSASLRKKSSRSFSPQVKGRQFLRTSLL